MTKRFISDFHYNHVNCSERRCFNCVEDMNHHIIDSFNSIVKGKDITYILGDLTMEKSDYSFLNYLNGVKKIILGNHDQPQHILELQKYVRHISGVTIEKFDGIKICLSHIPIHQSELEYRKIKYNIHGHQHSPKFYHPQYKNVCAENINYIPQTIEELGILCN